MRDTFSSFVSAPEYNADSIIARNPCCEVLSFLCVCFVFHSFLLQLSEFKPQLSVNLRQRKLEGQADEAGSRKALERSPEGRGCTSLSLQRADRSRLFKMHEKKFV